METRTYRAAPGTYALLGAITGLLSVLWVLVVLRAGAPWSPLAVPLGGFALGALWLSRFRVTLGNGELIFVAPFHGRSRLALADILSIEFATETGRSESPFLLSIRTSFGEELRLNAKVFPTVAVQHLLALSPRTAKPRAKSSR